MKIYKTLIFTAIVVLLVFSAIFSFLLKTNNNRISQMPNKKRILLLSQVYQSPYWQIVRKGALDAAKNRGCIIEYDGPQTSNISESLRIFDMGIAADVDGIITYVQENNSYIPFINKAVENGIPVITVETDAKLSKRMAFVGTNNIEAGYWAGRELAEITYAKANIGIIMGGMTIKSQVERVTGFSNYIKVSSNMKIIDVVSSNSDIIEAELVARKMIDENSKLDAIYCTSSEDGIGAARAVVESGKKGKITIVCFDDLPETLEYIKNDVIKVSIVQKPYQMGYESVNLMMDKFEGKVKNGEFLTGIVVVTKDNVDNYEMEKGVMN
jgi:ribose transport system substrate-binding protein